MSPSSRIALGALLGAIVTLLFHPVSNGIVSMCFVHTGPSEALSRSPWLHSNLDVLPYPDDLIVASLYMEVGAERFNRHLPVPASSLRTLIQVSEAAAAQDTENAFWLQMVAYFRLEAGDLGGAREAWLQASSRLTWNDYQSSRLLQVRGDLEREFGRNYAWYNSRLIASRSVACANAIERFASQITANAGFSKPEDLRIRYASILNGKLLRDGSRSIPVGLNGVNMVEFCTYPNRNMIEATPRILLVSRNSFVNALERENMKQEAQAVSKIFYENEGWLAETGKDRPAEQNWWRGLWASIAVSGPSAFLVCSILGGLLWMSGRLCEGSESTSFLLRTPVAPITGIAAATAAYATTGQAMFALTVVLSLSFVAFGPDKSRNHVPESFGALFQFLIWVLGTVFCLLSTAFIGGLATPIVESLGILGIPREYYAGGSVPLGLAGITLCLVLVIAPFWSYALRLSTPKVAYRAIGKFGKVVAITGVILGVVSVPFASAIDRQLESETSMILQNEPNFYLLQ